MCFGINAMAQIKLGVEAGVNVSHALETAKTKAGFNVGITADYTFANNWLLETALKLSSQPCGDDSATDGEWMYQNSSSYTPYYLTLPVRGGYKFSLNDNISLSVSAGPMIGLGLFGKGKTVAQKGIEFKSNNVFDSKSDCYISDSRFEYGANIRAALQLKNHYTLAFEYSILHLAGSRKAIDNMNLFSINLGYKF